MMLIALRLGAALLAAFVLVGIGVALFTSTHSCTSVVSETRHVPATRWASHRTYTAQRCVRWEFRW
jgi:hypothetical protein